MVDIKKTFGNKIRVRVCGICIEKDKVLMANHHFSNKGNSLWLPPGGGAEFEQNLEENLIREFNEETGLTVEIKQFLFVSEFINNPLHAIEIFFQVRHLGGELIVGSDPELNKEDQIISEVRFMSFEEINRLGKNEKHSIFNLCSNIDDLMSLNGYFKFEDKSIK